MNELSVESAAAAAFASAVCNCILIRCLAMESMTPFADRCKLQLKIESLEMLAAL